MNNPKKQPNNKWLQLITIPFQMGFVIFIFHYLGQYLDERNNTDYYVKILTLVGVFLSLYYVIKQVVQLNKDK